MVEKKQRRYAQGTKVSAEKTRAEIERLLWRGGAERVVVGSEKNGTGFVIFQMVGRQYKLALGERKVAVRSQAEREQLIRERWRALLLVVKAKLQLVESGERTVTQEFFGELLLPNNEVMSAAAEPVIRQMVATGSVPPLLLHPASEEDDSDGM